MFENARRGRQARNFTTNVPKSLDLKSSSEQIFFRKLTLGAPDSYLAALLICYSYLAALLICCFRFRGYLPFIFCYSKLSQHVNEEFH